MDDNESRRHQMFVRVRDFGQAHASDFTEQSLAKLHFDGLTALISNLDNHAAAESSGHGEARQGTESRAQARAALRDDLDAISRTARAVGEDVPGLEDKFRMPRGNNDQHLLNAARAFKTDATPLQTQFVAHEMPAGFLDELQDHIDALEAAISNQASGIGNHVAAGAAIDDTIDRGVEFVRKLDVIVRNKYADNPATLAEWTSVSHTERAPRRAPPIPNLPSTPLPGSAPPSVN